MKPVGKKQATPDQAAKDALEALEQAYAYYAPQPLPVKEHADAGADAWPAEYYRAA